jgi:hypothetical protein
VTAAKWEQAALRREPGKLHDAGGSASPWTFSRHRLKMLTGNANRRAEAEEEKLTLISG